MNDIRIPTCMDCPSRLDFEERTSRILNGTCLQPFEKYCTATRHPKQIRKSSLMKKPPIWCPRLKKPCELRVYGFIDDEARRMHSFFSNLYGNEGDPRENRYAVRYEGAIDLTAREFWRRCNKCGADLELPTNVELYEVVEIDDGLKPICFYLTPHGYQQAPLFKPEKVKRNTEKE